VTRTSLALDMTGPRESRSAAEHCRRQLLTPVTVCWYFTACTSVALLTPSSLDGAPVGQDPRPTFRMAVDLLPLEVQAVNSNGRPLTGLGSDPFIVHIDGRGRQVVHAEFVSPRGDTSGRAIQSACEPGQVRCRPEPGPASTCSPWTRSACARTSFSPPDDPWNDFSTGSIRGIGSGCSPSRMRPLSWILSGDLATANSSVGRLNQQAIAQRAGTRAAETNVALYILHFDTTSMEMRSARERTPRDLLPGEAGIVDAGLELVRKTEMAGSTSSASRFGAVARSSGIQLGEHRDGDRQFQRSPMS